MEIRRLKLLLSLALIVFLQNFAVGQDIHFSQFQNTPLNINPGLVGVHNGDHRFIADHKRQWYEVPVEYMTFMGSYDVKFRKDGESNYWSGGVVFNYDRAGDSRLSMASFTLIPSYTHALSPKAFLTGGVSIGFGQRSFKTNDLRWDNQWANGVFDPTRDPVENFENTNDGFFDLGAGINLRLQSEPRTHLDIGLGAFHLNQPEHSFYSDGGIKLYNRFAVNLLGSVKLTEKLDLLINGLGQFQGPYQELLLGGMLNIHINDKKAREVELALGFGGRFDDALIPQIALRYDGFRVGLSYDINTSLFDIATNERGGPEISVTYLITKVRPVPESKVCKIF